MVELNKQGSRPSTALASRVSPLSALISCFCELYLEPTQSRPLPQQTGRVAQLAVLGPFLSPPKINYSSHLRKPTITYHPGLILPFFRPSRLIRAFCAEWVTRRRSQRPAAAGAED
jgi:hypothetical protein